MSIPLAAAVSLLAAPLLTLMQMPGKQVITAGPTPVGPYSPAVSAGGLIYVSGTLAQDDSGALVGKGDVGAQTRQVLARARALLTTAGSSLDRVAAVTVYLKSASDFQAMNDAYKAFWPKDPPTRTTVIADFVLPDALVEMSFVAVPDGAERTVIHPAGWLKSPNPYSYAIRTGDTLFLSGLVSRNGRDNTAVAGDITAQTKVVMDNAGELLKAAGMGFDNVVSARVYLTETSTFAQMNSAYRAYFRSAPPARATVRAGLAGKDYVVEITMVASSSPREAIHAGGQASPNLSAAIRAGNRVYLSGALGNNAGNRGDIAAQTRETLNRLRAVLTAAGCTPADAVDALVYLTDVGSFAKMNAEYRRFFGSEFPARTTVGTGLVAPDGLVEIMLTAVRR